MMKKGPFLYNETALQSSVKTQGGSLRSALLDGVFLCFALALVGLWDKTNWVKTLSVTFVAIVLETFPFMLVGSLVGGLIEEFVTQNRIVSILPKGKKRAVFIAAGMGTIFPVCECAIVPVVRRLLKKGASPSAAIAFLLGGPIVNPIVFASTAVAYQLDWSIPVIRLGAGYVIAVTVGLVMGSFLKNEDAILQSRIPGSDDLTYASHEKNHHSGNCLWTRVACALQHAAHDFLVMVRFLIIGAFLAAIIQSVVDRSLFFVFAENPWLAISLMMLLAIVLNLCSEADAFVAAAFRFSVPLPGQMAFMVLGPMFDLKLFFMYLGIFRKKAIVALILSVLLTVYLTMVVTSSFLG